MIASIIKKVSLHAILEMVHHCDELRRATKFTIINQKPITCRGFVRSTLYRDCVVLLQLLFRKGQVHSSVARSKCTLTFM